MNAVDHGGLCHVSDNNFLFFCSIEEALEAFLTVSKVKELSHGMKSTIVKSVIDNEDVAFDLSNSIESQRTVTWHEEHYCEERY